jgi:hypothetical protein
MIAAKNDQSSGDLPRPATRISRVEIPWSRCAKRFDRENGVLWSVWRFVIALNEIGLGNEC